MTSVSAGPVGPTGPTAAVETRNLVKTYGATKALDGVDLHIAKGTVYGILGPNGAGKTTLIRILSTLARPTGGQAHVLGLDVHDAPDAVRAKVSLTGQAASVDEELTGRENLVLVGRLLGLSWRAARGRAEELLSGFGLHEAADRLVRTYSGGMRRRIDIAASIVSTPELLFLDEPTTGLDPRSRSQVWSMVRRIAAAGTTVVLTTQYLEEADRLADRLAVIDRGRIVAEGTSRELKARVGQNVIVVRLENRQQHALAQSVLEELLQTPVLPGSDDAVLTASLLDPTLAPKVLDGLQRQGVALAGFSLGSPSLDDVFFALTGRSVPEEA